MMKRLKRSRRGLGATDTEHADRATALFVGAEGELVRARSLAEHGLCQGAFRQFTLGAEFLAQAQEHEASAPQAAGPRAKQYGHEVQRLRQEVQGTIAARCVRGRS